MKLRNLGRDGPQVSVLGLGCMGFSEFYASSAANDAEAIGVIQNALSLGLTFLDTADMYGPYTNEILVGKAISGRRDQVFLATKFGFLRDPANPKMRGISGKPDYVRASCEGSLKRLNVERIDLYYQHRVDRSTPIEETVGAMAEMVKAGKIGAGRFRSIDDLDAKDFRRFSPRFQGENFAKNLATVGKVEEIAKEKSSTPAQLALAWLLAQGPHIVPIPGTTSAARLKENLAATNITLNAQDLARIAAVAPSGVAAGERYDDTGMRFVNG